MRIVEVGLLVAIVVLAGWIVAYDVASRIIHRRIERHALRLIQSTEAEPDPGESP